VSGDLIIWRFESESNYEFSIPSSWVIEKSQIAFNEVRDGTHDSPKEAFEGVPLVTSKNLIAGKIDFTNTKIISFSDHEEISKRSAVQHGDLLFSMIGTIGNVAVVPKDTVFSVKNVGLFRKNPLLLNEGYSYYWLESETYQKYLETLKRGGNQKFVSLGVLRDSPIVIPPLPEQQQIAQKLDELLAQVDTLKTRLDAIPNILKRFRQSVLAAAVSGRLTEGEVDLRLVGDVCEKAFDGPFGSKLKTSDYTDAGVRVARLENVGHLIFDNDKQTFISKEKAAELESNKLKLGDVLFSSFVDEEVRVCVFKQKELFINKADCFCLRPDPKKVSSEFLAYTLSSVTSYFQIKDQVQGVTRPRINLRILKSLSFNFPTIEEQTENVRRVEQLFAYADQIEQRVKDAQARVNHLTQSILAKAFRGELTADWRAQNPELISGENSAAALLERIRVGREIVGNKRKLKK
jgi:type I restriction enzyme, S subunit